MVNVQQISHIESCLAEVFDALCERVSREGFGGSKAAPLLRWESSFGGWFEKKEGDALRFRSGLVSFNQHHPIFQQIGESIEQDQTRYDLVVMVLSAVLSCRNRKEKHITDLEERAFHRHLMEWYLQLP